MSLLPSAPFTHHKRLLMHDIGFTNTLLPVRGADEDQQLIERIETRSLPTLPRSYPCRFTFYVAFPRHSIPLIATCFMSLIPSAPFNYSCGTVAYGWATAQQWSLVEG